MKKCIALASVLLTALCSIAQTEAQLLPEGPHMYIFYGQTCEAIDCYHMGTCNLSDSLVEVGLNRVYRVSELDSINFRRHAMPAKKAGWTGDVENGESYYYPLLYGNGNKTEYVMRFQACDTICQQAELLWVWTEEDDFIQMCSLFSDYDGGNVPTGNHSYVRRTLTRRRHPIELINPTVDREPLKDIDLDQMAFVFPISGLTGKPMDEVCRMVFYWTQPLADASVLPALPPFGTYTDGHYEDTFLGYTYASEFSSKVIGRHTVPFTVDFIYNEDKTRVVANEYRLTFPTEMAAENEAAYASIETDPATTISVEGTTIVIYEPCDLSPEEALQELVVTVVELYEPEILWNWILRNLF